MFKKITSYGIGCLIVLSAIVAPFRASPVEAKDKKEKKLMFQDMDYGPTFAYTIEAQWPKKNIAHKGLAIKLDGGKAGILYDMDTLRVVAAWVNDTGKPYLDLTKTNMTSYKGFGFAKPRGVQVWGTKPGIGWSSPGKGFKDPRSYPNGPVPEMGRFESYSLMGQTVVLKYSVGGVSVREIPHFVRHDGLAVHTRILRFDKFDKTFEMLVCQQEGATARLGETKDGRPLAILEKDGMVTVVGMNRIFVDAAFHLSGSRISLFVSSKPLSRRVPLSSGRLSLFIWTGKKTDLEKFGNAIKHIIQKTPLVAQEDTPSKAIRQWDKPITTMGKLSTRKGAYVIDTITAPEENPWRAWMRLTGFDFFADGKSAAVCTWNGDVWTVAGIDKDLKKLTWRRFATGLHEPLGLKIVKDVVYVCGRDQITRLEDVNKDGEADVYHTFNNAGIAHPRTMAFELQTDPWGNFYYLKNGNRAGAEVPLQGCLFKVSPDGKKSEVYATGFRSANGLCVGPKGQITSADNQGNWVPATRIDFVRAGGFYGYKPHAWPHFKDKKKKAPDSYEKPLCWIPHNVDASAGSQVWVPDDRWGPFEGMMLHTSYSMAKVFLVPYEEVGVKQAMVRQGGVVPFSLSFGSGIMRARFNPRDGQLYVCGLKGWQTKGVNDSGFYRVRYTGKPVYMPSGIKVSKQGVRIAFTCKLDKEIAEDTESYGVERWNYIYSSKYGSPEFSVKDPKTQGHDTMTVTSAKLGDDGKSVYLEIADMKPVMQMQIKMDLDAADGEAIESTIYHTVHVLGSK